MSHKHLTPYISRLMALLLCVMLVLTAIPTAYAVGGTCGSDLTWSFDGSTLTITGSGAMHDYSADNLPPWYEFRSQILRLSLPEGLTRVGSLAFYECTNLNSVQFPASVSSVGEAAFFRNSSLTMLTLNEGLRGIGRNAFSECRALADLRLPSTISYIENYAFSMCSSLRYITIPAYIRELGDGVFSYCENLIRVDVNAAVIIPSWSFYGCNQMQVVTVQGVSVNPADFMQPNYPEGISPENLPGYTPSTDPAEPDVTDPTVPEETVPAPEAGYVTGESVTTDASGTLVVDQTTVIQTENATISVTNRTPIDQQGNTTTTITSTIQNDSGWNDVLNKINSATIGGNSKPIQVTVYVPNNDTVPAEVLQQLVGKNVQLSIQSQTGSQYTLDCTKLEDSKKWQDLALNYTLVLLEEVPEELQGCTVYQLKFLSTVELSAELVIRLPGGHALSTATLYQRKGGNKLQTLQSVMVDTSGDAHWYVGAVDEKTEYLIGIDVPGAVEDTPIIPPALQEQYNIQNVGNDGVEYVITGRKSSWGMELKQVMGIMAAVMVGVIVIVGVVIFTINKRRLRKGYIAGWDDADDE